MAYLRGDGWAHSQQQRLCVLSSGTNLTHKTMPKGVHPRHLLWALYFLKVYPVVEIGRGAVAGKKELGLAEVGWCRRRKDMAEVD